jgi:hypothetical protein
MAANRLIVIPLCACFRTSSKACADNVDRAFLRLGPDHDDQTAIDQADCDETLLRFGVFFVEDFKVTVRCEEAGRLLERNSMFLLVRRVLSVVPRERHWDSVRREATKSMTYGASNSRRYQRRTAGNRRAPGCPTLHRAAETTENHFGLDLFGTKWTFHQAYLKAKRKVCFAR